MINEKELCKQIKQAAKERLIWTLEDGVHYITNQHWAVKYNSLPREVLVAVFSVFAAIPNEGRSLMVTHGFDMEREAVSMKKIFADAESNAIQGDVTNILIDDSFYTQRIIKAGDMIIRVKDKYMKLVDSDTAMCKNPLGPVSFHNNQIIILPIRAGNEQEEKAIVELLAS